MFAIYLYLISENHKHTYSFHQKHYYYVMLLYVLPTYLPMQMPGRVYNLSAENKDDCDDWTAVLSHTLTLIADIRVSSCV